VQQYVTRTPEAVAVAAPGREPLTYSGLASLIVETAGILNGMGIERGDRAALVLPSGPELATAFLAVSAAAACAPLNPVYREKEFESYLACSKARVLIIDGGCDSEARNAASRLGIQIIELSPTLNGEAGLFTIQGAPAVKPRETTRAQRDDVALLLHTSGTTAQPKLVPLTHANLFHAAQNIATALALSPADRCLNVMPLFHIHGLSTVFSSIAAGSSVVCPGPFSAPFFFQWMNRFGPTWYTASPTIHQAILEEAPQHREVLRRQRLRFLRSASAAMRPAVIVQLEDLFGVPFVEAYGMTEASPQIASNPLPPRVRKLGSVGLPAGPQVAIVDEPGKPLVAGAVGEIAVQGLNVMSGYEDNPEANEAAFCDGWFRTGDQGYLDQDGYLFITGRLKEFINRGGEKIAPREVEEALLAHPGVAQAVSFPVPHPRLGEDVAAAVVLRDGASVMPTELQQSVSKRLADFKVPRRLLVIPEIPLGSTGKVQRLGLAERLGLTGRPGEDHGAQTGSQGPKTIVEDMVLKIWMDVLRVEGFGVDDDFFALGGDSLSATQMLSRVRDMFQVELPMAQLLKTPTIATLARIIEQALVDETDAAEIAGLLRELEDGAKNQRETIPNDEKLPTFG
jgi:acyl-CoA synthetase (AMP-forming)/AMP-acid ligase II/acyl carrier protein